MNHEDELLEALRASNHLVAILAGRLIELKKAYEELKKQIDAAIGQGEK